MVACSKLELTTLLCIAGPTVIADQQYDNMMKQPLPEEPQKTTIVLPRANTMALFDGRLAHGVLESSSRQPRATLLINWWTYQPQVGSQST